MKTALLSTILVSLSISFGAQAAGGGGPDPTVDMRKAPAVVKDPAVEAIQAAVARSDWPQAQELARESGEKPVESRLSQPVCLFAAHGGEPGNGFGVPALQRGAAAGSEAPGRA